jgi:hypothetical protein
MAAVPHPPKISAQMPDSEKRRHVRGCLLRAATMLRRAYLMLGDLDGDDITRAFLACDLLAVLGRSVSLTVQNIRTYERERFNLWYQSWEDEMRADPLFRWFNDVRNKFLKEGGYGVDILGQGPPYQWHFVGGPRGGLGVNPGRPVDSGAGTVVSGAPRTPRRCCLAGVLRGVGA